VAEIRKDKLKMKAVRNASWSIGGLVFCIGASAADSVGYSALVIAAVGVVIMAVGCLIERRYHFEDEDDLRYL